MAGLQSLLSQQLAEAQAQGDLPRQVALASALLKERVSDADRLYVIIAQSCRELVIAHDPKDVGAVLGWYQTWYRHTRDPAVRPFIDAASQRVEAVKQAEHKLSQAMARRDVVVLRRAIEELSAMSDRLATTETLLEQASLILEEQIDINKRELTDRSRRADQLRTIIKKSIPQALDEAVAASAELIRLEPKAADEPMLHHINARMVELHHVHETLEQALAGTALQPLQAGITALQQRTERLSTSADLLARAQAVYRERSEQQNALLGELAAIDRRRPDLMVPWLEKILRLDPENPLRDELQQQKKSWQDVLAWHNVIADAAHLHVGDIAKAVHTLEHFHAQVADSPAVIAEGKEYLSRRRARQRKIGFRIAGITLVVGGSLAIFLTVWLRDNRALHDLHGTSDPQLGQQLAENYLRGYHFFHHDEVERLAQRFHEQSVRQDLEQLARLKPLSERLAIVQQRLQDNNVLQRADYQALHEQTILALDDQVFASALALENTQQRIAALTQYAQRAEPTRAEKAQRAIGQIQQQRDNKAWMAILEAPSEPAKMAALDQYIALPNPARLNDAVAMRGALEKAEKQREERAADDARWQAAVNLSDLEAQQRALEEYVRQPGRHVAEAQKRLAQSYQASDEQAWQLASAPCDPATSIERARTYLQRTGQRSFEKQAQQQLAQATWDLARLTEDETSRLQAVERYLADPANNAFRVDAQRMREELSNILIETEFADIIALDDSFARAQALLKFSQQHNNSPYAQAAEDKLIALADKLLVEQPDFVLGLPAPIMRSIPVSSFARLSPEMQARLPLNLQMQIPVQPVWAQAAGVDTYGRWAEITLGPKTVRLRFIPAGTLQVSEQLTVQLASPIWIAESELAQNIWVHYQQGFFSRGNPSEYKSDHLPVHGITREQGDEFIAAVQRDWQKQQIPARVRLPSKSEWQYIAYSANEGIEAIMRGSARSYQARDYARLVYTADNGPAPSATGTLRRDQWGLSDVLGNVSEWVSDSEQGNSVWVGGNWTMPRAACTTETTGQWEASKPVKTIGLRLIIESLP
jgi:Sulfatase-modifying factor enzyme 1